MCQISDAPTLPPCPLKAESYACTHASVIALTEASQRLGEFEPLAAPAHGPRTQGGSALRRLVQERIVVLDGAMGSLLQALSPSDEEIRGERFRNHAVDLKNNCDVRCITMPKAIEAIHAAYFAAGADIVETNTFNATSISQAEFGLSQIVGELNTAAVACARRAAAAAEAATPGRSCFVAGSLGPLNRTLSLSPDVSRPEYRAVDWSQVVDAYREQALALLHAGVDALFVETIFDTLNAKAAAFAIQDCFDATGREVPVAFSATVSDASGRVLSGQTVRAFYFAIRHANPFAVGLNCGQGGAQLMPSLEELAMVAECPVLFYPNAGLPNALGAYEQGPEELASIMENAARAGLVNVVGGCCGSTPEHIRAIATAMRGYAPRVPQPQHKAMRLSGLEPLVLV